MLMPLSTHQRLRAWPPQLGVPSYNALVASRVRSIERDRNFLRNIALDLCKRKNAPRKTRFNVVLLRAC